MELFHDVPIVSTIFNKDATLVELLQLVICVALFWAVFFYLFGLIVGPLVKGKPWLAAAGSRGTCTNIYRGMIDVL
jgi:hypothetical protein